MAICIPPLATFRHSLLRWYKKAGRVLPWRETNDPYAIWVSEIMLQQTQVATVLPYYHRFLAAFPTVRALSAAPLDTVLKIWEGMGYYARARSLHTAARIIVQKFNGTVPASYPALLSLPGIGRSTAGAILNIAALQRHPILDGNVKRILIRYFGVRQDRNKTDEPLWDLARQILPRSQVNHFTQAIMDLGATVCLPRVPQCTLCPVQRGCRAYQTGVFSSTKPSSKRLPHYTYVAAILQNGNDVLIKKRPKKGLLGGLWEFPGGRMEPGEDFHEKVQKEAGRKVVVAPIGVPIRQTFSHFKMTLQVVSGRIAKDGVKPPLQWVPVDCLLEYPFSAAHRKIAVQLQKEYA